MKVIEIKFIGLREGEKLHEELHLGDNPLKTAHSGIMMCEENFIELNALQNIISEIQKSIEDNNEKNFIKIIAKNVEDFKRTT